MEKIGVLAFQGGVVEHQEKLKQLGVLVQEVRYPKDLDGLSGLIIPGGESSCIKRLLVRFDLMEPLGLKLQQGLPVWGTCAGAILLSKKIDDKVNDTPLGLLDISMQRNGYGSQLDSFIYPTTISDISPQQIHLIFIRAPRIKSVENATPVITIERNNCKEIVAVRDKNILATTFHPELDKGVDFHRYFLKVQGIWGQTSRLLQTSFLRSRKKCQAFWIPKQYPNSNFCKK